MDLGLKGQTAIIIGGNQGIGRAIAEAFAAEGSQIGLMDLDPEKTEQAAKEIGRDHSLTCTPFAGDVGNFESVKDSATHFEEHLGRIDHVICTAAIGSGKAGFPFWNLEPADWSKTLYLNIMGSVHTAHAYAPHLIKQRSGSFLFTASVAGQIGSPTDPPYSASKAAVINFMQVVARDLAQWEVRANALSPGMVKTSLNQSVWQSVQDTLPEDERMDYASWAQEKISKIAPLGRWQEPTELGALAAFLASRHAQNITGQTLNVDGGQVMHS